MLVSLIKQVVKENIGKRLCVHTSMESLFTVIPKQILPIEYGGGECSINELHGKKDKHVVPFQCVITY